MATNNFKPFAIGNSANVTSQADYEALAALLTGFTSGKASSAQINKAIRQSTVMAYVLAQFISDSAAVDVLDNGVPATILANLKAGLNAGYRQKRFTTSGSFIVPAGVTTVYLSGCAGGGGGGGGSSRNSTSSAGTGGGGGGSGQSVIKYPVSVTPGQTIAVTIGAGGSSGPAATAAAAGSGGAGGNTIFGTLLTLVAGAGGSGGNYGTVAQSGGTGGNGYPNGGVAVSSQPTTAGQYGIAGQGASNPYGGGGAGGVCGGQSTSAGGDSYGFGSGGGGGGGNNVDTNGTGKSGGIGSPGLLIVEW